MEYKPFRFTETEAKITAKWEIGVRDYVTPLTALLFVLIGLVEVVRAAAGLPMPALSFYIADGAAVLVFVLALYYIGCRVNLTAADIQKRILTVDFRMDEGWLAVIEAGGRVVFRAQLDDIDRVDAGPHVVRLSGLSGAICLPRAQLPDECLQKLAGRLGKERFKVCKWM